MELAARIRTAHADAWAAEGALRAPAGGGALALTGIRVMASGLPQPQWNAADVTSPYPDIEAARAFYAERGLPLGVRVPAGMPWNAGRHVLDLRLMGLRPRAFAPADEVPGLALRVAGPADLETVLDLDAAAFGDDREVTRPWIEPHLTAPGVTVALAELDGEPAATAYSLRSDGAAGPCVEVSGVAVARPLRRRGIAAAISSWLLTDGFAGGARLAHLQADTGAAARVYARLGFVDAGVLRVFEDV
jgi:GNAT superfamily N-acetyltransferase